MRHQRRRRHAVPSFAIGLALAMGLASPDPDAVAAAGREAPFVVVLREHVALDGWEARSGAPLGIKARQRFRHALRGFAARLTPAQERALRADPDVAIVAPDRAIELSADVLPTGVDRVDADLAPVARIDGVDGDGHRVDVDVAVIDTGVQPNHPDLNVVGGVNCTGGDPAAWADWNGHGTHVAGTAAALDNGFGVVGVAPGARLWSVRVFKDSTESRLSWVVCGIDWITAQSDPADPSRPLIEVVNMSLRDDGGDDGACGTRNADAEHAAICRSVNRGITYVVAAGNDATSAARWRPASYNEVITVSALADFDGRAGGLAASACSSFGQGDVDDTFADFSNYGSDVDLIAPGKCIRSTFRGSTYATISGTSMASPTVAGGAALYKALHPEASPATVRSALRAAGSYAWATSTDPDGVPDPLLDVSSFGAAPGFTMDLLASSRSVWAGGSGATVPLRLTRGNGFADEVALAAVDPPAGLSVGFEVPSLAGLSGLTTSVTLSAPAGMAPGSYPVTVRATSGSIAVDDSLTVSVGVDSVDPSVGAPSSGFVRPATAGSTVPVRIAWSAADVGSGLALVELFESRDGGAFAKVGVPSATATAATRVLPIGHTYRHRVRATDASGRVSDWATGTTFRLSGYSESHTSVGYRGSWASVASSGAWGSRLRYTRSRGARVTFRFTGRQVAWVAPKSSGRGSARVYVDGVYAGRVSLYSSTSRNRQVVFLRTWVASGAHSLSIVNDATAGRPRIDVDGFEVLR